MLGNSGTKYLFTHYLSSVFVYETMAYQREKRGPFFKRSFRSEGIHYLREGDRRGGGVKMLSPLLDEGSLKSNIYVCDLKSIFYKNIYT